MISAAKIISTILGGDTTCTFAANDAPLPAVAEAAFAVDTTPCVKYTNIQGITIIIVKSNLIKILFLIDANNLGLFITYRNTPNNTARTQIICIINVIILPIV